jgi:CPA1 family monovalent cation:H+ antiporter
MNNELLQTLIIFFVLGLVSLNALTYYSNKIMLFPDIIWILLLGLLYSGLSHYAIIDIPQVSLDANFILYVFVPLLIFASTQKICLFHLKKVLLPSSIIASVGILISMLIIAVPLFVAFDFGWLESLLFGAIISATDPLAVGALLHHNKSVAESQKLLIEGESILNDGFVVTIFGILGIVIFTDADFNILHSGLDAIKHILGALAFGLLIGRLARWVLDRWHEEHFTLTVNITLAAAYGSFFFSEMLGLSGILSVFAAALAYGYKPKPRSHNKGAHTHVWDYFEYIANAVLFFMLGASFFVYFSLQEVSIILIFVSMLLLILSRLGALTLLYPLIKVDGKKLAKKDFLMLNFSGARGAVSIALILLLPNEFVYKSTFLSLAFLMIFASLIVYPLLIKRILME